MSIFSKPDLLNDSPLKALSLTTLPMIIGISAYMSFNLIDSYFVGQLGTEELAAIGYSFPIVIVFLNLAIGLSIGTTSVLSRLMGQHKVEESRAVTTFSIYLATIFSIMLALLGLFTIGPLFSFIGADSQSIELIHDYMVFAYLAMAIRMISISISSIFKAVGNTFIPSLSILITSIFNLILDPIFIFGWGPIKAQGISGAGVATLLATICAFVFEVYCCFIHFDYADLKINWDLLPLKKIKEIFTISIPAALSNALNPLSIGFGNWLLSSQGESVIAGYGVATKIQTFCLIPIFALSAGFGPFVGQNTSSGQRERIQKAYKQSFLVICFYFFIIFLSLLFLITPIAQLFSSQKETIEVISSYVSITALSWIGYSFVIISSSGLNAINKPFQSLFLISARTTILLVPLSIALFSIFQSTGFWYANTLSNILAGLLAWLVIKKTYK